MPRAEPILVTVELLKSHGACSEWCRRFRLVFPDGLPWNRDGVIRALAAGFGGQIQWLRDIDDRSLARRFKLPSLKGADLSGFPLKGADLSNAILEGANLRRADLTYSILWDADLRGADMVSADLRGAGLANADLTGAKVSWFRLEQARCLTGAKGLPDK